MGISLAERQSIIYHAIAEIVERKQLIASKDPRLATIIEELWPAFIPHDATSATISDVFDHRGSWNNALIQSWATHEGIRLFYEQEQQNREQQNSYVAYRHGCGPDIARILGTSSDSLFDRAVYEIHSSAETILFATVPGYRENYKELRDTVCRLIGRCYQIFSSNRSFLEAYLVYQIWDKIWTYEETDLVNQFIRKAYLHDHIKQGAHRVDQLMETWKKIQFRQLSTQERLLTLLEMLGGQLHAFHTKLLDQMIDTFNEGQNKENVSKVKVSRAVRKCLEARKDNERRGASPRRDCLLTQQSNFRQ